MRLGIVTISYNQAEFLEKAICSVQLKNPHQLSYVIVDPGSLDKSRDIVLKYKDRTSNIIFEADKGPADGLNKGFSKLSDVDILGYLNSDDVYSPGALDYVIDFFKKNPQADILNGAIKIINDKDKVSLRGRTSDPFNLTKYSMGICTICQQATFFRKSAFDGVGGFNTNNKTCWDGELMVDMALAGYRFATVRKVLGSFRIYSNSITGSKRMQAQYLADHKRLKEKIVNANIKQYPIFLENGFKILYKLDIRRHYHYFLAR